MFFSKPRPKKQRRPTAEPRLAPAVGVGDPKAPSHAQPHQAEPARQSPSREALSAAGLSVPYPTDAPRMAPQQQAVSVQPSIYAPLPPGAASAAEAPPVPASPDGQRAPPPLPRAPIPHPAIPRAGGAPPSAAGRTAPARPAGKRGFAGLDPRQQRARLERAFRRPGLSRGLSLMALCLIWALAAAYYVLVPSSYISKWALILPAANSGSSVTLETIGQAQTNPGQPFGSVQLSPKVIYREIATSDQVRQAAAQALGMTPAQLGRARIKLIDETSLMNFQITGRTPQDAQARGRAMILAFQSQLDVLRKDEFDRRAKLIRENLTLYQASVDKARERILEFQRETGLLSLNQFNEASLSAEQIRRKIATNRTEIERMASEQSRLMSRIGLAPDAAAAGLRLAADPAFARLATAFAESATIVNENNLLFGPNHPARIVARVKGEAAYKELMRLARGANLDPSIDLRQLVLLMNASHHSELMRVVVSNESQLNGRRTEITALEKELQRLEVEVGRMGADAARLEALKKDHLVAEAVLTSAMARLDTNRSDLYSSYPLVQVLSEPDLPDHRTQPRLLYAVAAGLLGSLFVLLAWGAAWVRMSFSRKPRKST